MILLFMVAGFHAFSRGWGCRNPSPSTRRPVRRSGNPPRNRKEKAPGVAKVCGAAEGRPPHSARLAGAVDSSYCIGPQLCSMKWGPPDAPRWTIAQAMQVMQDLAEPFRDRGYRIAMHGSVPKQGDGDDLDLVAIPNELAVPPPAEMEKVMHRLLDAQPYGDAREEGLLRTWCRGYILPDGHKIDMEYLLPVQPDLEKPSLLFNELWDNGYLLVVYSYGQEYDRGRHDLKLLATPVRSNVTPPEEMEARLRSLLSWGPAPLQAPDVVKIWRRAYVASDGKKIEMQYLVVSDQDQERP